MGIEVVGCPSVDIKIPFIQRIDRVMTLAYRPENMYIRSNAMPIIHGRGPDICLAFLDPNKHIASQWLATLDVWS